MLRNYKRGNKTECGMCMIERARGATTSGQMDMETFAKVYENILWEMRSSNHKKQLVCSKKCFDAMIDVLDMGMEKCRNSHCRHTKRMHVNSVQCTAVRCKCERFITEEEEVESVKQGAPGNIKSSVLESLIEQAKKL